MDRPLEQEVQELVADILEDYKGNRAIDKMEDFLDQPDKDVIINIVNKMLRILFPGYYRDRTYRVYNAASQLTLQIEDVMYYLNREIAKVLKYSPDELADSEKITMAPSGNTWRQIWKLPLTETRLPPARMRSFCPTRVCWPSQCTA